MSDQRVTASVKRDHIHLMNKLFKWDGSKWVAVPEVFFNTPGIAVDMGNFVGALNHYEREQYPDNPPPPAEGPLARLDAAPSQWAKYCREFFTDEEIAALAARTGNASKVHEISAFYDVGGIGNVRGFRSGNSYQFFKGEVLTPDVDGAADAYVKSIADAQGKTVPQL